MANFVTLLKNLFLKKKTISVESLPEPSQLSPTDLDLLKKVGVTYSRILDSLSETYSIRYERSIVYRELERALTHPLMSAAAELYAEYSTPFNPISQKTVWIQSKDSKYQAVLSRMLEEIDIEEKIFDWAYQVAAFGDLFVKIDGHPGLGIVSLEDGLHPSVVNRLDCDGILLGFYESDPQGTGSISEQEVQLIYPWTYVHFRLLGAVKRRIASSDPSYTEMRAVYLMGNQTRVLSTRYGTSLLFNALPAYKRLRMVEDALYLSRLTRGIQRIIYKIKVEPNNPDASAQLIQEYMNILKHARAVNLTLGQENLEQRFGMPSMMEDLFVPVFGDAGDVTLERIGGEPDIKWIADIEEFRNQLACALRVPLQLLGGYVQEASGQLGSEALEQLDIRFARAARRLQRALKNGIKKMCQIHLAYLGMDPDPRLFDVVLGENSSAEETHLREALDSSLDAISKFYDLLDRLDVNVDKVKVQEYFNSKLLKMSDFELSSYVTGPKEGSPSREPSSLEEPDLVAAPEELESPMEMTDSISKEFFGYLPLNEKVVSVLSPMSEEMWKKNWGDKKIVLVPPKPSLDS